MVEPGAAASPTVCIHTFPLPFRLWADKYVGGQSLVTTDGRTGFAALLAARAEMPQPDALLPGRCAKPPASIRRPEPFCSTQDGFVTEATTANLLIYSAGQGLVGPPHGKVLPGISLAVLVELAQRAGIPYSQRELRPADLAAADEVLLTSTSVSVIPVTRFNGQPIGRGKPGPIQEMLLTAWSRLVGVDIAAQANRFATR